MTARENAKLARLERRAARELLLMEFHDRRQRRAAERLAEVDNEVYELKKSLGLLRLPNTRETVTLANTEYIFRKLYPTWAP